MTEHNLTRRAAIGAGLAMLVGVPGRAAARGGHRHQDGTGGTQAGPPAPAESDSLVATLGNPWAAGQNRARVSAWDNDPFIIELEGRLKCTCGCAHSIYTCRTTDFTCGFWQGLHANIIAMAEQGATAQQIVDAYVAEHGVAYLMAPPPQGFNLAAYFVPGVLITVVGGAIAMFLKRRERLSPAAPAAGAIAPELSPELRARLERELAELDT